MADSEDANTKRNTTNSEYNAEMIIIEDTESKENGDNADCIEIKDDDDESLELRLDSSNSNLENNKCLVISDDEDCEEVQEIEEVLPDTAKVANDIEYKDDDVVETTIENNSEKKTEVEMPIEENVPTDCDESKQITLSSVNVEVEETALKIDSKIEEHDMVENGTSVDNVECSIEGNPEEIKIDDDEVTITENDLKTSDPHSITISFSSKEIFHLYKEQFTRFLHTFNEFSLIQKDNELKLIKSEKGDVALDQLGSDWVVIDADDNSVSCNSEYDDDESSSSRKRKRKYKEKEKRKETKEDKLFMVDTEPSNEVTRGPMYRRMYKMIEDAVPKNQDEKKEEDNQAKMQCFNCSGNHTIRECTKPKDLQKIKLARQKIVKGNRYHLEEDNKFSHLRAGVISERLRKALGMRKHDIPAHIYKMRVMGYPPGWLDEAKVLHSNLALFDSDGKKDASSTLKKFTIDPNKIVDYPGFNCQPDRGSKDECNYYGVPPYSTALSKENMLDFVSKTLEQQDPVPETGNRSKSPSPSLIDLEAQKKELLEQLTTNDDSNASNNQTPIDLNESVDATPLNDSQVLCETPVKEVRTPSGNIVKTSAIGTPILKSLSPFARLPNNENFSKDMSPIINFENLPNSTGKYEQMSAVLTKVRSTLKSRFQET